jgi:hypothetical protein
MEMAGRNRSPTPIPQPIPWASIVSQNELHREIMKQLRKSEDGSRRSEARASPDNVDHSADVNERPKVTLVIEPTSDRADEE